MPHLHGVHRRDELEARREADAIVGARDHRLAALQRLAERIQHLRGEFRQLVEEKHAVMGERGLARPGAHAATNHGGHRGGMVRGAERALARQAAVGDRAGDRRDHRNFEKLRHYPAKSRSEMGSMTAT